MISEYLFRPQVVEDETEADHIEELTQWIAFSEGEDAEGVMNFTELVVEQINDGDLEWHSPAFEGYCRGYGTGMFSDDALLEFLRRDSIESEHDERNLKLVAFIALVEYKLDKEQYSELICLDDEFGGMFEDKAIYQYYKSRIYQHGESSECIELAIKSGHEAATNIDTNPNVPAHFASLLLIACSHDAEYDLGEYETKGSTILETAKMHIHRSITSRSDIPEYSYTLSQILVKEGDFDGADNEITNAIQKSQEMHDYDFSFLRRYRSRIDLERQQSELDDLGQKTDSLNDRLSGFEGDLEEATDKYRTQMVQFIGFFAALITVATISVQIIQQTPSFDQAARLILVLTGGLLIAFGGFGILLPQKIDKGYTIRIIIIVISGVLTVGLGWYLPSL